MLIFEPTPLLRHNSTHVSHVHTILWFMPILFDCGCVPDKAYTLLEYYASVYITGKCANLKYEESCLLPESPPLPPSYRPLLWLSILGDQYLQPSLYCRNYTYICSHKWVIARYWINKPSFTRSHWGNWWEQCLSIFIFVSGIIMLSMVSYVVEIRLPVVSDSLIELWWSCEYTVMESGRHSSTGWW